MKLTICILAFLCCFVLCSCTECAVAEQASTEVSITSGSGKKAPTVNVQVTTVSHTSQQGEKATDIQPRPEVLPQPATAAEDKKKFL